MFSTSGLIVQCKASAAERGAGPQTTRRLARPGRAPVSAQLIDSCITRLKAQDPSKTCTENKEDEEVSDISGFMCLHFLKTAVCCLSSVEREGRGAGPQTTRRLARPDRAPVSAQRSTPELTRDNCKSQSHEFTRELTSKVNSHYLSRSQWLQLPNPSAVRRI